MTDNEKAAIAAGLHTDECELSSMLPHHPRDWCAKHKRYETAAPDMHLPENLWRAVWNLNDRGFATQIDADETGLYRRNSQFYVIGKDMFAALVALYDAEHPA